MVNFTSHPSFTKKVTNVYVIYKLLSIVLCYLLYPRQLPSQLAWQVLWQDDSQRAVQDHSAQSEAAIADKGTCDRTAALITGNAAFAAVLKNSRRDCKLS